jgi:integrase
MFRRFATKLGYPMRFHDLRGSHETALLDRGVAVHTVAERCGHDAAMLLKAYAKRTKRSDGSAAQTVEAMGLLGRTWVEKGPSQTEAIGK